MTFKMKGPTFFNVGKTKEYGKQNPSAAFQQKKEKTLDDYLDEGFSQVEAEQMLKEGATTGRQGEGEIPSDDRSYYNKLVKKEKDGSITKSEQNALDRLRAEEG